jgi:hypothetical protein
VFAALVIVPSCGQDRCCYDPRAAPFADADWDLRELATGHWAMFSAPEQAAEALNQIAA